MLQEDRVQQLDFDHGLHRISNQRFLNCIEFHLPLLYPREEDGELTDEWKNDESGDSLRVISKPNFQLSSHMGSPDY